MRNLFDTRRPLGRLCYLLAALLLAFGATYLEAQAPQTTQVTDIVYRPDGTPAQGTLLLSWPSFTSANGDAVVAGSMSVLLGPGGTLSVALVPTAGADPAGIAYTVVYQLNDQSVRELLAPYVAQKVA